MERNTDRHVRRNTPLWIEGRREGKDDQEELLEVREPLTDFVPSIFMVDLVLDTVNKPSPLVDELIVGGGHLEEFDRVRTTSKLSKAVHE